MARVRPCQAHCVSTTQQTIILMTKLTEAQVDAIESHMLHEEDALRKKFKAKSLAADNISVTLNEKDFYEQQGYTLVSQAKRKCKLSKPKPHGVQFEDDIWCMFYRLGFRILNRDEHLVVQWGPNPGDTQQLDVVAVSDEAIFVVECKAAEKSTPRQFKQELNAMTQYMQGVADALRQIYGKAKKVRFIFATRNYRVSDGGDDAVRMQENGIFHLNDNAYQYIKNLTKSYKESAIYQFYGLMFKDKRISSTPITIPALKGKMGNKTYFLFSIEPSTLLKIGFVLHRTRVNDWETPTYQRLLVPSRLKGLTKFIDGGGFFPNSIILNFSDPDRGPKLRFDSIHAGTGSDVEFGLLNIPNAYGIAYIIDGQHRVYGYANSKYKNQHTIPVVAFQNMPPDEQLKIFMEINENQKAVSPSLRLDLEEDLYWNSPRLDSRMKALRSSVIKALAGSSSYILYNKISVGEDISKLSFKPFDTALGHSGLIPKATATQWVGETRACLYNTNDLDVDRAMREARKKISQFINDAYEIAFCEMDEKYQDDFLFSNRATFAFITLVGSLHSFLVQTDVIKPSASIPERIDAMTPYLVCLADAINNFTEEDALDLRGALGQGADTYWLRSFQNIVSLKFPDYCPEELEVWRETKDQGIQKECEAKKADIREQLSTLVFELLEKIHGEAWETNVALLKNTVEGRILKDHEDSDAFSLADCDWKDYVEIAEFKDIIAKNFNHPEFAEAFSIDMGAALKSKKDKLAWLNLLKESKGGKSKAYTRADLNYLVVVCEHLQHYMSNF